MEDTKSSECHKIEKERIVLIKLKMAFEKERMHWFCTGLNDISDYFLSFLDEAYERGYLVINPRGYINDKPGHPYGMSSSSLRAFAKIYVLKVGIPDLMGNYDPCKFEDEGLFMEYFEESVRCLVLMKQCILGQYSKDLDWILSNR